MMRCPECGSELPDATKLCPACGAQLTASDAGRVVSDRPNFFSRYLELFLLAAGVIAIAGIVWLAVICHLEHPFLRANQPLDHANWFTGTLLIAITAVVIISIVTAQNGRLPFIRRIPGLNAIDEAVGRATEMGRPILFTPGIQGLAIPTLQALAVAAHVARSAARYSTRMILPICDPTLMPITEQMMREVYTAAGKPEAYRPEDIRYLTDRQFAFAAGVTGLLHREKVAASFLFGYFAAEALILAENGLAVGAIQVAGTPDLNQVPFFVVSCDYTIIADEFYAASAYLSKDSTQMGSLVGQDLGKTLLLSLILVGVVISIFTVKNPLLWLLGGGIGK